jgi:purine nucleosidase
LAMVLNWPDAELLAVTTVAEHQGKRAGYVRYVLGLADRKDIPVAAGADVSLDCYRAPQGLPDEKVYWPEPITPVPTSLDQTLSLFERSIEQGAIIVAVGPLTNLALLEKCSPGILRRAKLYLMGGGYVFPPREGFPQWANEMDFNVQIDVQSANDVIEHSSPTFVPLAVTVETSLRRANLARLRQAGPVARLIARQAEAFATDENYGAQYGQTCKRLPEDIINFLHDPLACAIALGWREGVEISEIRLKSEIKDGWLCHAIDASGKPTQVVTRVNAEKFDEFWLSTVASQNNQNSVAPVARA